MGSLLTHRDTILTSRSGMDTINSRFSIRKDRNDGVDFQYDAVIRNREERKRMLGSDCECCREASGDTLVGILSQLNPLRTSTMKLLGHYQLRDSHSGGRQQSARHLAASTHRTTTRKIPMWQRNINN